MSKDAAATWEREWAVRFYDGLTTPPQPTPEKAQEVLDSYRRAAPRLPAELVYRFTTDWTPAERDETQERRVESWQR